MYRRKLLAIIATGVGLALALLMSLPSFAAAEVSARPAPTGTPEPAACRVIDFEKAAVKPVAATGSVPSSIRHRLTVSGMKPASNVTVKLVPLVYVRQPEYWGIEVVGCSEGLGLPVLTPYTVTYDFTGPLGSCGIEVIGANKKQQFNLAGCKPVAGR